MIDFVTHDFFQRSPLLFFPVMALVLFLSVWGAVALWTALGQKDHFEAMARLPLEDGSPVGAPEDVDASAEGSEVDHG